MEFGEQFVRDKDMTDEAVRFDFSDGTHIVIRRIDFAPYQGSIKTFMKANAFAMEHDTLPPEEFDAVVAKNIAKHLLTGWGGYTEGGKPLPFSEAEAAKRLAEYSDFRKLCLNCAKNRRAYVKVQRDAALGNSPAAPAST